MSHFPNDYQNIFGDSFVLHTLTCTAYASFVLPHQYCITFYEKVFAMLMIVLVKVSSTDDDIYHKIEHISVSSTNESFFN